MLRAPPPLNPKPEPTVEWVERFWRLSAQAIVDAVARVLDALSAALKADPKADPSKPDPKSA